MTGIIILGFLLILVIGGLWWFGRLRGATLQLAAAALMLGAAGYDRKWVGPPHHCR